MTVLDERDRTAPERAPERPSGEPRRSPGDRAALARAVLAHAEQRTGARSALRTATAPARDAAPSRAVPTTTSGPSAPTSARELTGTATAGSTGGSTAGSTGGSSVGQPDRPPLPVSPALAALLPEGALRRGTSVVVTGSTSLLLALVAQASQEGSWVAVVGLPAVGLLAAQQAGVVLDRFALVPRPGPDGPTVLAALLDGVDVVVVGDDAALADSDRRRLTARARERGAVLLSTTPWPGAQVVLTAEPVEWTGLGAGHGHLHRHRLAVTRNGRGGAGRGVRAEVVLPVRPGTTGRPAPASAPGSSRPGGAPAVPLRMVG